MRGGAQAHLVEAEDGFFYVLKARNNPQHRRILINEWVASACLRYLQLPCPETALLSLEAEMPEMAIQRGTRNVAVEPGWHFGSRFPGDPVSLQVYDYLPDKLLEKVANRAAFPGMFAFDKWTANADSRQAIFHRAQVRIPKCEEREPAPRLGFVASFIDHGFCFQGPAWRFSDAARQGLYHRTPVYGQVTGWDSFEPWLSRIEHFPDEVLDKAMREIPASWFDGPTERDELEAMLELLLRRRAKVRYLVETCREPAMGLFPAWT